MKSRTLAGMLRALSAARMAAETRLGAACLLRRELAERADATTRALSDLRPAREVADALALAAWQSRLTTELSRLGAELARQDGAIDRLAAECARARAREDAVRDLLQAHQTEARRQAERRDEDRASHRAADQWLSGSSTPGAPS